MTVRILQGDALERLLSWGAECQAACENLLAVLPEEMPEHAIVAEQLRKVQLRLAQVRAQMEGKHDTR